MVITIATAIGTFLFESATAGIIGESAYKVVSDLYKKRHKKTIASLYVQAFKQSVNTWKPSLNHVVEDEAIIEVDEAKLEFFISNQDLDISASVIMSENEFTKALAKNIENYLILPGHTLPKLEIERLAVSIIRTSAEFLVEEISKDEDVFRLAVLNDSRLAAFDRDVIIKLLERLPIMLNTQILKLDKKLDQMMYKIEDILVSLDQQRSLGFSDKEELKDACELSVDYTIGAIPKYNARLYVPRESIEWEITQFLKSEYPVFLLQGEAGVGKTNFLCQLARDSSSNIPTLFFLGTTHMVGRLGFFNALADEIAALNRRSVDPASIVQILDDFLSAQDSQMLVIIDAINENKDTFQLKRSLGYASQDLVGTRIKICISCRDVDWHLFEDEERLIRHLYEPKRSSARISKGLFLSNFSDHELKEAWKKYSEYYRLRGTLTSTLENICRHPLMLQFLCDSFQGQSIPPGVHRKEIFDRYWNEKILSRGGRKLESAIYALANELFKHKSTELSEYKVVNLIGDEAYRNLLSEQVIIYTFLDKLLDQNTVGFTYEAFLEYTLARYLRQTWNWRIAKPDKILKGFDILLNGTDNYRILQGVIQYLVLFVDDQTIINRFLLELSEKDTRWKIFFCDIQTKLDKSQIDEILLRRLINLAIDPSPQVRWAVGNVLGYMSISKSSTIQKYIEALSVSNDWMKREVAAFASGHSSYDLEATLNVLEALANDINWRVRRAVGLALNNLCETKPIPMFNFLDIWNRSDSWQVRYVAAKSQKGLFVDPHHSVEYLKSPLFDENEEVRWITIISLVSFAWDENNRFRTLELLEMATDDDNYFVRKQIATLAPDLFRYVGEDCKAILLKLMSDKDNGVRWELARSLGNMTKEPLLREILESLKDDPDMNVSFAAQFSLGLEENPDNTTRDFLSNADREMKMFAVREKAARANQMVRIPKNAPDLFNSWKGDRYSDVVDIMKQETTLLTTSEEITDFFNLLLADESEGIRWALATILSTISSLSEEQRFNFLRQLTNDQHYWVRREAISSIKKLIPTTASIPVEVFDAVKNAIFDNNPEVRYAVIDCLLERQNINGNPDDIAWSDFLEDDNLHIRKLIKDKALM